MDQRRSSSFGHQSLLRKTDEAIVSDDDVIEYLDAQHGPGFAYAGRHLDVLPAWSGITAGMVVGKDDGGCVPHEGFPDHGGSGRSGFGIRVTLRILLINPLPPLL